MAFRVVTLTQADQQAWRALRLEALERFPEAFLTTAAEQRARPPAEDRAMLAQGNWRGLILAEHLVAIAALIPMTYAAAAHRLEIGAFYVSPDHWGTGAAQALLDGLTDEARGRGALQLELSVAATNPRACSSARATKSPSAGCNPSPENESGVIFRMPIT